MEHVDILTRLLPPVAYETKGSAIGSELASVAAVLDDALKLLQALINELDPRLTYSLLEDFERVFGLPDLCLDLMTPTVADRRLAVLQQMIARGGQSRSYFEGIAAAVGYEGAVVQEYTPWTCTDTCAEPIAGDDWRHVWSIQTPQAERVTYFTAGSPCTEPLANWSAIEALACVVQRLKPAQTVCFFDFGA